MGYKLKKEQLLLIAEYVITHKTESEEKLVSGFYDMLMGVLETNKESDSDKDSFDEDNYIYLSSDSEDDKYILSIQKNQTSNKENQEKTEIIKKKKNKK
jgi:hypothetical protein